ncbi:type IV pilin protein [Denitrificimonas sp. JX-1]|uniref:Type IV pilin protein n=1 Tax=Denitrificimonas halotolerans TaxID=3098930 RepID=A0ABU5GV74_9GAMM|nr:type IV pilin protein [Denitrificimonas sp. JX-1]MDY7219553.1 type IV pilin protein [Denitrificimonas sp. JX-1]
MISINKGFSLIELMWVLAIVGIMLGLVYPRYDAYLKRGYRSEGQAFLIEVAARQERYFAQNNHYFIPEQSNGDLRALGLFEIAQSATKKYRLEITQEAADGGFTLMAWPQFTDLQCGALSLNGLGIKGHNGLEEGVAGCWR